MVKLLINGNNYLYADYDIWKEGRKVYFSQSLFSENEGPNQYAYEHDNSCFLNYNWFVVIVTMTLSLFSSGNEKDMKFSLSVYKVFKSFILPWA